MRQFGHKGQAGILTAAVLFGGLVSSEAGTGEVWARCSSGGAQTPQRPALVQRHDARTGFTFSAELGDQRRAILRATSGDLQFEKRVTPEGETQLRIVTADDSVLVVFNRQTMTVSRGASSLSLDPRAPAEDDGTRLRHLLGGSRVVREFRSLAAVLELGAPEEDDVFATAILIDGALVGYLDGDPGAIARIAKRVAMRRLGRLLAVKASRDADRFEDCVGKYEGTVSWAWSELVQCNQNASDDGLLLATINMSMCNAEWVLRAEGAWFQFISCMAVPM